MSAGGSDMPGGGCITAGEVRPGRGGGLGGKRRGLLVGGALLQVQLPAAGKGMGPYLAWAERHFSPPEGGLWGPQDKEGEDHSTSSLLLPGLEEKPGCRLGSKLPAAPGHRAFRGPRRRPLLLASGHLHSSPHTDLIAWRGPGRSFGSTDSAAPRPWRCPTTAQSHHPATSRNTSLRGHPHFCVGARAGAWPGEGGRTQQLGNLI